MVHYFYYYFIICTYRNHYLSRTHLFNTYSNCGLADPPNAFRDIKTLSMKKTYVGIYMCKSYRNQCKTNSRTTRI